MFRNRLIADSGKGHVEEMIRMLRDIPGFASARLNLLHVVSDPFGQNLGLELTYLLCDTSWQKVC